MDDVSVLSFYVADVFELLFYVADGSVLSNSVDDGSLLSTYVADGSVLSNTYYSQCRWSAYVTAKSPKEWVKTVI